MKCDVHDCDREATVHLTEIVNDNITKLHLCEEHAKQKGVEMEQHFGIADLLQGLAEYGSPPVASQTKKIKCPNCGMGYDDFKKVGRLGCGQCYNTFRESIVALLKRIHGSTQHMGKTTAPSQEAPKEAVSTKSAARTRQSVKSQTGSVAHLKERLRKAIDEERYEEAAKLRDEIRVLEGKSKKES